MSASREPLGERVRALEADVSNLRAESGRTVEIISKANFDHHESLRQSVDGLSKHITAETNRWLKSFYWIAFALMTVGGVTVGNTKLLEKIFEALFK